MNVFSGETNCLQKQVRTSKKSIPTLYSLILSPAVAICSAAPALTISLTSSVSLRNLGQKALQQLLATVPRYSLLQWVFEGGRKRRGSEILSVLEETHPQRLQSPDRRLRLALWLWGLIRHLLSVIKRLSVTDTNKRANKLQKHKLHLLTY